MNYTTIAAIQKYLLITIDSSQTGQVESWIGAMSRFIDKKTNRVFGTATESTRVFDGSGWNTLIVDDLYDLDSVTIAGTTQTVLQYPANETPTTMLKMDGVVFDKGMQNVSVVAKFAYGSIPDDIAHACTVLTAGIINAQTNQDGEIKSEKIGDYTVTYKDQQHKNDVEMAMTTLNQYRRQII